MAMEYYQGGGIEVELTSHDGAIVSRTMPQDYEYRGTGECESSPRRNVNDTMHQPRRSYDGNLSTAIPVKRLMSFGGKDSDSMVNGGGGSTTNAPVVWDAPPATEMEKWDVLPAPTGGIEKENESSRYLRSYERRPAPSPLSSMRSLKSRGDDIIDDRSSTYSHSEYDDDASDISSSAMGSLRRRNRISKKHAEKLLIRQQQQQQSLELKKKKKPLSSKTSINEVKPKPASPTSSALKPAPKNVSFGAKSEASKTLLSVEHKLRKVPKATTAAPNNNKALVDSSSCSTEEKSSHGPLTTNTTATKNTDGSSSSNSVITPSVNSNSPDRSVSTNWTYSTGGSGRVYRTQIICSSKYKGRVMDKVVTLSPDDLQIGRTLEGLENGFVDQESFAHALITALFDADIKKEPLYRMKEWQVANSTVERLEKQQAKKLNDPKPMDGSSDTATTAASEESNGDDEMILISPPSTKRIATVKPPLSPKESGDVQFAANKSASLQYKDVFGMALAKGIVHFYEDRDEIWIEDYHFCFASRRFKFLTS